jgi:hypothetical protein
MEAPAREHGGRLDAGYSPRLSVRKSTAQRVSPNSTAMLWWQPTFMWRRANADPLRSPLRSREESYKYHQNKGLPLLWRPSASPQAQRRSGRETVHLRICAAVSPALFRTVLIASCPNSLERHAASTWQRPKGAR